MMNEKKMELAGVWSNWATDPPEERHGDSQGRVLVRWQDASGCSHSLLPWRYDGKRPDCEWLDTTPEALQVDNGDGTVTLYGVSVTVPAETITQYKIVRVGRPKLGEEYLIPAGTEKCQDGRYSRWDWIIVEPITPPAMPPSWKPPASLPDGVYHAKESKSWMLTDGGGVEFFGLDWYSDFTPPSHSGYWRVKNGEAEYLGTEWKGGAE